MTITIKSDDEQSFIDNFYHLMAANQALVSSGIDPKSAVFSQLATNFLDQYRKPDLNGATFHINPPAPFPATKTTDSPILGYVVVKRSTGWIADDYNTDLFQNVNDAHSALNEDFYKKNLGKTWNKRAWASDFRVVSVRAQS